MAIKIGDRGDDRLVGTDGPDLLDGNGGSDTLIGGAGNDQLLGNAGQDLLRGGAGDDYLVGGADGDRLYGGPGADRFIWNGNPRDPTGPRVLDNIFDFDWREGDRIDVREIDANVFRDGNQAFEWRGTATFTGQAGEARLFIIDTPDVKVTTIEFDRDGDRYGDLTIGIPGARAIPEYAFLL